VDTCHAQSHRPTIRDRHETVCGFVVFDFDTPDKVLLRNSGLQRYARNDEKLKVFRLRQQRSCRHCERMRGNPEVLRLKFK
jgi:hypothetical protein